MAIKSLTKDQRRFYGLINEVKSFESTTYLDMFRMNPALPPTQLTEIEFDVKVGRTKVASLKKRSEPGITILSDEWIRVKVKPGMISASIPVKADDYIKMAAGEVEVLMNGQLVKTPNSVLMNAMERLRSAVDQRKNIMCFQAVNDGSVVSSDGTVTWDYKLPKVENVTWSPTVGIIKILSDGIREFRKRTGKLPNRIEVGANIADNMLKDDDFLAQMQALNTGNRTNIANMSADEKALVIGQVLGKMVEEMDMVFDEKGVSIVGDNRLNLLDTTAFRLGYAGIEIKDPVTKLPNMLAADMFVSVDEGTESNPTANIFAKSAAFPVITDVNSVLRYEITIA